MSPSAPDEEGLDTFLVERYWPGVSEATVASAEARLREVVTTMVAEGISIRYLRSTLLPDEEAVFSLFAGRSVDEVAAANRRGGVPFDRIVRAMEIGSPDRTVSVVEAGHGSLDDPRADEGRPPRKG